VARAGQPGAHQAVGRVERLLGPRDRLAELPVALTFDVAGGVDPIAERGAARRDVLEEAPRDHVVGVALRRARELSALADGGKTARRALGVDDAEQRGTAIRRRQNGDEITAMGAGCCFCRDGCDDQEEESRRQRRRESILATHGAKAALARDRALLDRPAVE
jgi:hypothetical protein